MAVEHEKFRCYICAEMHKYICHSKAKATPIIQATIDDNDLNDLQEKVALHEEDELQDHISFLDWEIITALLEDFEWMH